MPRKAFVADVQAADEKKIPGISSVVRGPDDDVIVSFVPASGPPIEINFMAQPGMFSSPRWNWVWQQVIAAALLQKLEGLL